MHHTKCHRKFIDTTYGKWKKPYITSKQLQNNYHRTTKYLHDKRGKLIQMAAKHEQN